MGKGMESALFTERAVMEQMEPKLSDFFDCWSVFGQRGENQSGFGVTAGQKWFECGPRSERTTLGGDQLPI